MGIGRIDFFDGVPGYRIEEGWGYRGQYFDKESCMYYMRARYYNTDTGRFITEDPIKDGYNWYAYCENNPVMFVDFNGLKKVMVAYIAQKKWWFFNSKL